MEEVAKAQQLAVDIQRPFWTTVVERLRQNAIESGRNSLESSVRLLARHFDRELEDFSVLQKSIIKEMESRCIQSADVFRGEMATLAAYEMLRAKASGWSDIAGANVFDSDGILISLALKVAAALAEACLSPDGFEVEITETALIRDDEEALTVLQQLRGLGVRIALDDFGTGYFSLSHLHRFPFDKIKIDRSFICDVCERENSSTTVQAVVTMATA